MEPAAGEEAEAGPGLEQVPAGEGRAGQRDESEAVGPGGPGEPARSRGDAAGRCWDLPATEDAREPLLPGHEEPPGRGASLPLGHDPAAAASPGPGPPRGESASPPERAPGPVPSAFRGAGEARSDGAEAEPGPEPAGSQDECPICTEPYDERRHKAAVLNCSHGLCRCCLRAIMDTASEAELGRVRCPICRQKTPMLEWEICKLQEELLLLHSQPGSPGALAASRRPALPARRPGLAGALEHRFQVRFHSSRMFGCLPCVRYPACLIRALARLERRCRCCYLVLLALLLAAEMLSLLLIFLPILLMVMLFLILDK